MNHRSQLTGTSDWLLSAAKQNPEGLLLLAAGAVLLMRKNSSSRLAVNRGRSAHEDYTAPGSSTNEDYSAANTVRSKTEPVFTAADRVLSSASQYADKAKRTAAESSDRLLRQAQSTYQGTKERVLRDSPLLVALAGAAAGAALAAAFPPTDLEKQTIGPIGTQLNEAASNMSEQVKEAAGKAGETLKHATDQHGLNVDGVKEVGAEVADSFRANLMGESDHGRSQAESSAEAPHQGNGS